MHTISERVLNALVLTSDFYHHISESHLTLSISNVPSNTIGEQAGCIIGARESYLKALKNGEWVGFSCSLSEHYDKNLVMSKFQETSSNIQEFLLETDSEDINLNLLMDLLEHEVQHHGQLIRYAYANKLGFPKSWNERYTV